MEHLEPIEGVYSSAGILMPPHEIEAFWRLAFAHFDRISQSRDWQRAHPELRAMFPPPTTQLPPQNPRPEDIPSVPYRPVSPTPAEDESEDFRDAYIAELVKDIVSNGIEWAYNTLRKQGYNRQEIKQLVNEAKNFLVETHSSSDADQLRAIATSRLNDLFRLSIDAVDYRTALAAQKELNRVWGVVSESGGNPLAELANLALLLTKKDPGVLRLVSKPVPAPRIVEAEAEVLEA